MELGAEAVLINTAIAFQPKKSNTNGWSYEICSYCWEDLVIKLEESPKKPYATASSPIDGLIQF